MSETKVVVNNANELLLLASTEVRHISLKDIAHTSIKGLRHQESDVELYEFLFANIIHLFDPHEFEGEVSSVLLPELVCFLDKIQVELQSNALSFFFVDNLTILLRLAEVLLKLVEYLTAQAEEQCHLLRTIIIFPEYLLRCYTIVRKNYVAMAHEPEALEAMKTLYAVCKKMLMAFLDLLCPRDSSRGGYFRFKHHEEEFECLEKVCTLLASVGNEISPIDSLLASDVWKVIVKLCTEHVEQLNARNKTSWLCEIISILNTGIDSSLSDMRTKNEPSKQSTIALKLNAFFLRVMLKLLALSKQHVSVDIFTSIISTVLQVKTSLRSKTLCSELVAGIEQYLHIGYMAIMESAYRIESFAKALTLYECKTPDEIHSFYILMIHIVTQMVSNSNDTNLLSLYCLRYNLMHQVCNMLKRSDSILYHNPVLYNKLLVHCAGLILMSVRSGGNSRTVQKMIEETLVRMIFQEHYYTALLGIDLWSIFVRYHSTQLMYAYFLFWKKCNDQYAIFTSRPKQVYVRQLLRNLYIFLPITHQEKLQDTFPISERANDRLWAALGPALADGMDEARRKQFAASLEKRLSDGMQMLQQNPDNVDTFFDVLSALTIVGVTSKTIETSSDTFWNTQLKWHATLKAPTTGSIFDCVNRNIGRLSLGSLLNAGNATSLLETSSYVKYQIVKLLTTEPVSATAQPLLEVLLKDNVPFVAAFAQHSLHKLKEKKCSIAQKILWEQPNLQTQISQWHGVTPSRLQPLRSQYTSTVVTHRCHQIDTTESSDSMGDLTLAINNKIDELFPDDDDDDIEAIDVDMSTDGSSLVVAAKKRKFNATSDLGGEEVNLTKCLDELQNATSRLERYVKRQPLLVSEKVQLQRILSSLTNALGS
uniref:Uncharacterized protein n=1 Tax=Anopheles farauti TaxID=69004 RepID=A0A182Q5H0_9DIPT